MPSSSLVEFEVEIRVEVEVGVEDEVDVGVRVEVEVGGSGLGLLVAMFTTFTGGWVVGWLGGWCGEVKNRANLSQVRLKLRLSLATSWHICHRINSVTP